MGDRDDPPAVSRPSGWVQIVIRCPPVLLRDFDAAAHLDERSRAAALRVAMRRYINDQ